MTTLPAPTLIGAIFLMTKPTKKQIEQMRHDLDAARGVLSLIARRLDGAMTHGGLIEACWQVRWWAKEAVKDIDKKV